MSNCTTAPPAYGSTSNKQGRGNDESAEPLLGVGSSSGAAGIWNQGDSDIPDDFKYGVTVSESETSIRHAFIRKVYTILFMQVLATCIVAGTLSQSTSAISWVQQNTWAFFVPLFGTLVNLGFLYWKRHSHPINLVLLSTFTLLEAFAVGVAVAFYENIIVLQALLITLGIFLGLTIFTFQSKYDFSGMGPWLFGSLIALVFTGLVSVFFPFNRTVDLIYAIVGTLIFSGYIVYDTYLITKRLSVDEYIMGAISLYLDFINLFLSILRLLNNVEER